MKLQLESVADAFRAMRYTAVGVGMADQSHGEDYYKAFKQRGIPVVQVDTVVHENCKPYIIKQVAGGVKVGILSFGATADGADPVLRQAMMKAFSEARKSCDVLVLMDQASIATDDWIRRNAEKLGSADIVLGSGYRQTSLQAVLIGSTWVVPTSTKGASADRVDIEIVGKEKKFTCVRTDIDQPLEDNPDILKIIQDFKTKSLAVGAAEISAATKTPSNPSMPADRYFAYQSCTSCHALETEQWKTTGHAKALATLVKAGRTSSQCLKCHSDMFSRTKSLVIEGDMVAGVECQSCHDSVLPHGADFKKKVDPSAIKAVCVSCHNQEQDPKFDIDKAYELVKHKKA